MRRRTGTSPNDQSVFSLEGWLVSQMENKNASFLYIDFLLAGSTEIQDLNVSPYVLVHLSRYFFLCLLLPHFISLPCYPFYSIFIIEFKGLRQGSKFDGKVFWWWQKNLDNIRGMFLNGLWLNAGGKIKRNSCICNSDWLEVNMSFISADDGLNHNYIIKRHLLCHEKKYMYFNVKIVYVLPQQLSFFSL